jgi:hypothetical protein
MSMPAFTAEASLYTTLGRNRTARGVATAAPAIHASAIWEVGEEVIEVEGDAPGLPWGWHPPGDWGGGGGLPTGGFGGGPRGGSGGGPKTGPKSPAKETKCTTKQLQSPGGSRCVDQMQEDIRNCGATTADVSDEVFYKCLEKIHYVRCTDDNRLGCCRDLDERRPDGTRKRQCEPAGVVPPQ